MGDKINSEEVLAPKEDTSKISSCLPNPQVKINVNTEEQPAPKDGYASQANNQVSPVSDCKAVSEKPEEKGIKEGLTNSEDLSSSVLKSERDNGREDGMIRKTEDLAVDNNSKLQNEEKDKEETIKDREYDNNSRGDYVPKDCETE